MTFILWLLVSIPVALDCEDPQSWHLRMMIDKCVVSCPECCSLDEG